MQDFFKFLLEHWGLSALFLVILALLILNELRSHIGGIKKISSQTAVGMINKQHAAVVDLRDQNAYRDGHIAAAINIPAKELESKMNKLQKYKKKPLIFICGNGQDSMKTGLKLQNKGFEQLYSLQGGVSAWRQANYPLVKGKS